MIRIYAIMLGAFLSLLFPSASRCENALSWVQYNEYGKQLFSRGDYDGAEQCWETALRIAADCRARKAESLSNLGKLYSKLGKVEDAKSDLEDAIKIKREIYGNNTNEINEDLKEYAQLKIKP